MTPAEAAVRVLAAIEAERMRREDAESGYRTAVARQQASADDFDALMAQRYAEDEAELSALRLQRAMAGASRAVDRVLWAALTCFAVALVVAAHHLIGVIL